jgi:putative resolvase
LLVPAKRVGRLIRSLSDPDVRVMVVEHRDRLARFGVAHLEAVLCAQGRRIVVADPGETTDDLAHDMIEMLTGMCARLCGRRGAWSRAMRALSAAKPDRGGAA